MAAELPTDVAWKGRIDSRRARADYYFNDILEGQEVWFNARAGRRKQQHYFLALVVIGLGVAITLMPLLGSDPRMAMVTAVLGALVTFFKSVDTLLRPAEAWQGYRKASERMKQEYRLYINNADSYADEADEDATYRLFVTLVEAVIAEEAQVFWQGRGPGPAAEPKPAPAPPDADAAPSQPAP